jgi:hypothetical protein
MPDMLNWNLTFQQYDQDESDMKTTIDHMHQMYVNSSTQNRGLSRNNSKNQNTRRLRDKLVFANDNNVPWSEKIPCTKLLTNSNTAFHFGKPHATANLSWDVSFNYARK